jgi:hypothetical protein
MLPHFRFGPRLEHPLVRPAKPRAHHIPLATSSIHELHPRALVHRASLRGHFCTSSTARFFPGQTPPGPSLSGQRSYTVDPTRFSVPSRRLNGAWPAVLLRPPPRFCDPPPRESPLTAPPCRLGLCDRPACPAHRTKPSAQLVVRRATSGPRRQIPTTRRGRAGRLLGHAITYGGSPEHDLVSNLTATVGRRGRGALVPERTSGHSPLPPEH